ncbi:MAG TPA: hypothetical protein VFG51_00035, partial [Candidatus Saccharimonadia bacterium]|nr:hypothetical protein [Candidatus Saccharimonadia bacterium]
LDALKFWWAVAGHQHVNLEYVQWRHLLNNQETIREMRGIQRHIAGIHATTGKDSIPRDTLKHTLEFFTSKDKVESWAKLKFLAPQMLSLIEAMEQANRIDHPIYVNTHAPYILSLWDLELFITHDRQIQQLVTIEPTVMPKTMEAVEQAGDRLTSAEVEHGTIFDIFHVIASHPDYKKLKEKDYTQLWEYMLAELRKVGQCIIHLPIGREMSDSIPLLDQTKISIPMLRQLADFAHEQGCYFTIEYQLPQPDGVMLNAPPKVNLEERRIARAKFDLLSLPEVEVLTPKFRIHRPTPAKVLTLSGTSRAPLEVPAE